MSYFISITSGPVFSKNPASSNETFSFTYTIKNTGDAPAVAYDDPFQQGVFVGYRFTSQDGNVAEENAKFFANLGPGESAEDTQFASFDKPGVYTLIMGADPREAIGGVTGKGQGNSVTAQVSLID